MIIHLLSHLAQTVNYCPTDPSGAICDTRLPTVLANPDTVQKALSQFVFPAIAAIAVFFIIMAGLKFITAQGEPQSIAGARKTIIYAALGLVIALSGEAIVTWVIGRV